MAWDRTRVNLDTSDPETAADHNDMVSFIKDHSAEHITAGDDAIPVATAAATGLCPILSDSATEYLNGKGLWTTPAGGGGAGDVVGPAVAVDNEIARFDSTTGKLIQVSLATIDDNGSINIPTSQAYKINNTALAYGDITSAVGGPATATDNAFARFDSTTGKLIQNSLVTADDSGSVNIPSGQKYKINTTALAAADVGALPNAGGADGKLYIGKTDGTWAAATLTQGSNMTITNADGAITLAATGGGSSRWTALTATTDFATTGASTSTITMASDQRANIPVGSPIQFTLNGTVYYAQCTALANNLMTIRGAPLDTTAGHLTALAYGTREMIGQIVISIPSYFGVSSATTLKDRLGMSAGILWSMPAAYFVGVSGQQGTADTGGTQPVINLMINGSILSTSNTNTGISMSTTTLVSSVVDINVSNYDIQIGEYIELKVVTGSNADSKNLTVYGIYVLP